MFYLPTMCCYTGHTQTHINCNWHGFRTPGSRKMGLLKHRLWCVAAKPPSLHSTLILPMGRKAVGRLQWPPKIYILCVFGVRFVCVMGWRHLSALEGPCALQPQNNAICEAIYGLRRRAQLSACGLQPDWGKLPKVCEERGFCICRLRLWVILDKPHCTASILLLLLRKWTLTFACVCMSNIRKRAPSSFRIVNGMLLRRCGCCTKLCNSFTR